MGSLIWNYHQQNLEAENIIIPISVSSRKLYLKWFCFAFFLFRIIALSDKSNFIAVKYSLRYLTYYHVKLPHLHYIKEIIKTWCLFWRYSSKNQFIVTCVHKRSGLETIAVNHRQPSNKTTSIHSQFNIAI